MDLPPQPKQQKLDALNQVRQKRQTTLDGVARSVKIWDINSPPVGQIDWKKNLHLDFYSVECFFEIYAAI